MAAPSSSTDPKELIWPAPVSQVSAAREFLRNWFVRSLCSQSEMKLK